MRFETVRGAATLDLVQSQWLVQHGRRVDSCPSEGLGTGQDGQVPSLDVPDLLRNETRDTGFCKHT